MSYKTAEHCTFREMVDRFDAEINRAIYHDYPIDTLEVHRASRASFIKNYGEMLPGETIREFEARRAGLAV